jgi:hypothetical protein
MLTALLRASGRLEAKMATRSARAPVHEGLQEGNAERHVLGDAVERHGG